MGNFWNDLGLLFGKLVDQLWQFYPPKPIFFYTNVQKLKNNKAIGHTVGKLLKLCTIMSKKFHLSYPQMFIAEDALKIRI